MFCFKIVLKKAHENQEKNMKFCNFVQKCPVCEMSEFFFLFDIFLKMPLKTHGNREENIHGMHWSAENPFKIDH